MLDLSTLEQALQPIESVGYHELTFEVEGHQITLRPILPSDEVKAQRYSNAVIEEARDEDGNVDAPAAQEYFRVFKTEVVAHCLAQIDELDLRDVDYVATGQTTPSGKPVRVRRHVAVRNIIEKRWTGTMLDAAFKQYNELTARIELEAENIVEYDPADLDAEIGRVEDRLRALKAERSKRAAGDPNVMADKVARIAGQKVDEPKPEPEPEPDPYQEALDATRPLPDPEEDEEATTAYPVEPEEEWAEYDDIPSDAQLKRAASAPPRKSLVPPQAPPPTQGHAPPRPPRPEPTPNPAPAPRATHYAPEPGADPDPAPHVMDSFGDIDDEAALRAEQERIVAARRKFARERQAARDGRPATGRTPPHRRGSQPGIPPTPGIGGGGMRAATPEELGRLGVPVPEDPSGSVHRPTEELSARGRGRHAGEDAPGINQTSRKPNNPNFRGKG